MFKAEGSFGCPFLMGGEELICRYCGKEFMPKTRGRKNTGFCCKHCADNYRSAVKRYGSLENKPVKMVPKDRTPKPTVCHYCGKEFIPSEHYRGFCSDECRRKAERKHDYKRKKERRRITGDYDESRLNIQTVFNHNNGICQICGLPVPEICEENDDWAASIDHVIPISKGGSHTYFNSQLAHRICNSLKQDTPDGHINWDQMIKSDKERWLPKMNHLQSMLGEYDDETANELVVGAG